MGYDDFIDFAVHDLFEEFVPVGSVVVESGSDVGVGVVDWDVVLTGVLLEVVGL